MQAVILAGGRGERLKPLTDKAPKPMIEVDGKPFLHHLIIQLRNFAVDDVLILAGYKSEVIVEYFERVRIPGVDISISVQPEDFSKSERLLACIGQVNSEFLLLYSDNYAEFALDHVIANPKKNVLTVARKNPGNVVVSEDTLEVLEFSPGRRDLSADYVEIGYAKFDKKSLFEAIVENKDLDTAIMDIANSSGMGCVITDSYSSISDIERLEKTRRKFKNRSIILIDRDGVITKKPGKAEYLRTVDNISYIQETISFMLQAVEDVDAKFIVITNQAGIARGVVSTEQVNDINQTIQKDLRGLGIEIIDFLVCPHGWNDGCNCRKPEPGMLFTAANKHNFTLANSMFIGDDIRDAYAALRAGTLPVLIDPTGVQSNNPRIKSVISLNGISIQELN